MAATAYASLVSLLNTLDQIHTHPLVSTFFDINQNKSLSEIVDFFIDFVEKYSHLDNTKIEDLLRRIADVAREAEDSIEVHAADQFRRGEVFFYLRYIMRELKYIKQEVIKVKEVTEKGQSSLLDLPPSSSSLTSSPRATTEATTMVGFDDYVEKLFNNLIGHDGDDQQIISIIGIGGIGKTTLARKLYEHPHVKRHFHIHVWVTISQNSSAREVLLQALSGIGGGSIDMCTADEEGLSLKINQTLFSLRYLIVFDDVWSVQILDKIKFYFRENKNGSRIVVTTRESNVVDYIGASVFAIKLLDEENSWKLFCEKTFPEQDFPNELKEVKEKIVRKCGGLPLAISVVGGFLGKSPRTHEYWEKIVQDKSMILNLEDNNLVSILYLSYKHLPVCLKSCFLYLGLYPEDSVIDVFQLIKLWVAEGFIKANRGQSLEEIAESYLNDLAERNLLSINISDPRRKSCSTHDLVRDFCIMIGKKENFFCVQRSIDGRRNFIVDKRRSVDLWNPTIIHHVEVPEERSPTFKTRLFRVFSCDDRSPYYATSGRYSRGVEFGNRLLTKLCATNEYPDSGAIQEVNMRFLCDDSSARDPCLLPPILSRFWCLQTLIFRTSYRVTAPAEIWKMPQLRHIETKNICLPDLPPPESDDDVCVLENLQTLEKVEDFIFTEEVCKRIPNIKKLGISCGYKYRSSYHLEYLGCFKKLESLYCKFYNVERLQNIKFPSSLKELTLLYCNLEWSSMAVIASLPHLQFLRLEENSIATTEWDFVDETFVSLKCLHLICPHVKRWIAQSSNFPVLEELSIWDLWRVDGIPSGIGEIPTLKSIYLDSCSESTNISAVEILHERESSGNMGLKLAISNRSDEASSLRQKIEELELTCQNLVVECESYIY